MELADQVYVFCPEYGKGIMFYDQSPTGIISEMTGTLPDSKFWSSGEKVVEWNDNINGVKDNEVPVNKHTSLLVECKSINVPDGDSYTVSTIMVSKENFMKILSQTEKPTMESSGRYKIIDFNSKIFNNKFFNALDGLKDVEFNNVDKEKPMVKF